MMPNTYRSWILPAGSGRRAAAVVCVPALLILSACAGPSEDAAPPEPPPADVSALPDMPVPVDNPITPEKVELGKQLFFDTRLSGTGEFACVTCHLPEMGWADGKPLSTTAAGNLNTRHTPTLYNVGYYNEFYWDGRMPTLEENILAAWRGQMAADSDAIAMQIAQVPGYAGQFQSTMQTEVTADAIVDALATFVRTLVSEGSPWDRYEQGDANAVSAEAILGFDIFAESDKANCTLCHLPPLYTDTLYHNIGVGFDRAEPDMGRGAFLARQENPPADPEMFMGAFKTPTMRSVTEHPPYFHDGSAATLEEVVDYVLSGGHANQYLDERLQARTLTPEERSALLAFIRALTPEPQPFERPALPE